MPTTAANATPLRVMTFNIRRHKMDDGVNNWPDRKSMTAALIQFYLPDLLGVQEAFKPQMDDLTTMLPSYKWLGVGRDDGREAGEFAAIFYRADVLEPVANGTFWLSKTPEKPGSKGWGANHSRVVTWGHFRLAHSGREFFHFNTHFDHNSALARDESAFLLLRRIAKIAEDAPAVVTGDFNCDDHTPPYQILTAAGINGTNGDRLRLLDTRYAPGVVHYGPSATFHGFSGDDRTGERIDYIFVTPDIAVHQHAVLTDQWGGRCPSDHFPVLTDLRI